MLKDVFLTVLLGLPVSIPLAMAVYGILRLLLKRFPGITQVGCTLVLVMLAAGMLYGILRFSGIILFPDDNTLSAHWFSASWRDDGFRSFYGCGTFAAAILVALHAEKKNPKIKE